MPRNIIAVFRVSDEVISQMSVEMFSLFMRYFTALLPSYAPLYVLNNDLLVMMVMMMMMMMMMMIISLISYFSFRDQLSLDLSK